MPSSVDAGSSSASMRAGPQCVIDVRLYIAAPRTAWCQYTLR